jgi:2-(3-amino-3-carboxypropyl)histidine synthase
LYIFVEIAIDAQHLTSTVRMNFPSSRKVFHERLLAEETHVPTGNTIDRGRPTLTIEGPALDEKGKNKQDDAPTRLALVSTIQFVAAVQKLKDDISAEMTEEQPLTGNALPAGLIAAADSQADVPEAPRLWHGRYEASIPRSKPLSPGEILGCTAPRLSNVDALMYVPPSRLQAPKSKFMRKATLETGGSIWRLL